MWALLASFQSLVFVWLRTWLALIGRHPGGGASRPGGQSAACKEGFVRAIACRPNRPSLATTAAAIAVGKHTI